ncbi:hypothetical protein [Tomitella biformata]|uniref:hypothetical protein n=1 Tax=Tomitella biformata TaxID=630403 RepID=UPI0004661C49|nr:hypothetical protein [Tomitella biformata]
MSSRTARARASADLDRLAAEIDALPFSPEIEQATSCLILGAAAVGFGGTDEQVENGAQLAIAGLHLTRLARVGLGQDPGPMPPRLAPAPKRSRRTPHYYPGPTADSEWPIPPAGTQTPGGTP